MMVMNATPIRRIYDMPGHQHYGPARRLWMMLEQLFADRGGISAFELGIWAYQDSVGRERVVWDAHLANLIGTGLGHSAAQRMVMLQFLTAAEYMR